MIIIGCDYHPGFQQIALVDTDTGEVRELRLEHREPAEKFYRSLAAQGAVVRVGMEGSGHTLSEPCSSRNLALEISPVWIAISQGVLGQVIDERFAIHAA